MKYCVNGHLLTGDNVYATTDKSGYRRRQCKICVNQRSAIRRLKLKIGLPTKNDKDFRRYEKDALLGCQRINKVTGRSVRCLECPLEECIYVILDSKSTRVKTT